MKKINWKTSILSCMVCLLPILFGLIFYDKLPDTMAIHFNINNEADGFASKNFALFGIPVLMTMLQLFCCIICDINETKKGKRPKLITIVKWIIPILSVVISIIMIEIPLGSTVDVRRSILLVLGILYLVMGNYFPKMSYEQMKGKIHPMPKDEKTYRKISRLMGYTFVIFGGLLLLSIIFKPIVSWVIILTMIAVLLIEVLWFQFKNSKS